MTSNCEYDKRRVVMHVNIDENVIVMISLRRSLETLIIIRK